MSATAPLVELRGVSRRYPGVRALEQVGLELRAGEVHALCGSNGAGKSTLVRLLGGVERPDEGELRVAGQPVSFASPIEALRAGIAVVHQETHLVPQLSVAENLFLGRELRRGWRLDWPAMRARARTSLAQLGLELDVDRKAATLTAALAQLVAIARALDLDARVLVLDEPTSSLDASEVERLFALVRRLRERGLAIVFVGHSLEQVEAISDTITVLRDGRRVGTHRARELSREQLVASMLGRELASATRGAARIGGGAEFLAARGLGRRGAIEPFDLAFQPGMVVGLAGLLGSGRSELARALFAADRPDQGAWFVDGAERRLSGPRDAIERGLAFCSENRKLDGIFPSLTVAENIAIASQRHRSRWGLFSRGEADGLARASIERFRIACSGPEQPVGTLSGGNQQKVLLSRALTLEPRLVILDEPTRGIDVGAKAEVEQLVEQLAARGTAVLFISSALEEVLRHAGRVLVLRDRRVVATLEGAQLDAQEILRRIAGDARDG
ncbi:MAG: sugar ABC transporter ATP-binding protein [Planctomycetota bacterium]|nr:sugar ABC transporter ATP-binding protein [Planctomycetota bacterium]